MILITGYGFLGKSLAADFQKRSLPFRVADRNINHLSEKNHVYFDLNNPATYTEALQDIETLIHLIHPTVPANSVYMPSVDLHYNIECNRNFLEHIATSSVKNILYISTGGAIYGLPQYLPVDEQHPCQPISNYGKGKLLLEELYLERCNHYNINLKVIRPSNIYGKFQKADKPQGIIAHIADAITHNKKIQIWGDGTNRKDFLYINDFTNAISLILSCHTENGIYNISSGEGHSLLEIIGKMENILQKKLYAEYIHEMSFDVKSIFLSNEKFSKDYNWTPQYSLETGLKDLISTSRKI